LLIARYGLLDGNNVIQQSIESLESQCGANWRAPASGAEGKFFKRREPLWNSIKLLHQQNPEIEEPLLIEGLDNILASLFRGMLRKNLERLLKSNNGSLLKEHLEEQWGRTIV
jgi:hypothetical protein